MRSRFKLALYGSAALALVAGAALNTGSYADLFGGVSVAHAQENGHDGGGHDGGGGQGGGGQGAGGQGGGGQGAGGQGGGGQGAGGEGRGGGGQGAGQGGPGEDSEGQGPRAGQGGQGDSGGKPAWAQEGIPEVELGRLSVARSPEKVLDRALAEVITNWDPALASLYNMSAEAFSDYVADNWDAVTIVDSPLQNLALMEALFGGTLNLSSMGVNPASTLDLAAIFLGVASDKNVSISQDTVIALNVIMDLGLDSGQIATLAAKAEDVREGVLEGHG